MIRTARTTLRACTALLVCGCAFLPANEDDEPEFSIELTADRTGMAADLHETALVTASVRRRGTPLPGANVRVAVSNGALLDWYGNRATSAQGVTDPLGVFNVSAQCASLDDLPTTGVVVLNAMLLRDGAPTSGLGANSLAIACNAVSDSSSLFFFAPQAGELIQDPNEVQVRLDVRDYDGSGADAPLRVVIEAVRPASLALSDVPAAPACALPMVLVPEHGAATAYIHYPGDAATASGPVQVEVDASFVTTLGETRRATLAFRYGAP